MYEEMILSMPLDIMILLLVCRKPFIKIEEIIHDRRRNIRREDRRIEVHFRRQGCSLEEPCEVEDKREREDRRDISKEKRRKDRRALERIKRI
ncbi:MAG: hypothetical protein COA44_00215 [Arcobacter sp.]|nr:MAG: hypothetical protein COA44_00215 [Arcobacter sp.]